MKSIIKIIFIICCQLLLTGTGHVQAQTIKYSSENIYVGNPDQLHFVGSIDGTYHLVSFVGEDKPSISIFDKDLQLTRKATIPFRFPDKSRVRIISLEKFYYILIYTYYNPRYILWKVDGNGHADDMTDVFRKFISSRIRGRNAFEMVVNEDRLYMLYHSYNADIQRNQTTLLELDSLFNVVYTHKVMYKLERGDAIQQERLLGKDLVILKTGRLGTSLVLLKVDLTTGYTINCTFNSSGYPYTQSGFKYNSDDSTFTVYSLLKEPWTSSTKKRIVFVSRLNNSLIEERPFTLLKSQFAKNAIFNFVQVAGDQWIRVRTEPEEGNIYNYAPDYNSSFYRYPTFNYNTNNYNTADPISPNYSNISYVNMPQQRSVRRYTVAGDPKPAVRFSLLDKNFSLTSDSLMANNRNAHTIEPENNVTFSANKKSYMLIGQRFFKKSTGLLMLNSDANNLVYTDVRVNNRNEYMLSQSKIIPQGVIIPYTHKREAGLVKIAVE